MVLCLPSPACKDRVGEKIGSRRVNLFADAIHCEALGVDGWRTRHDRHKQEIMRLREVTGLFAHLVPQEDRGRGEVQEAR